MKIVIHSDFHKKKAPSIDEACDRSKKRVLSATTMKYLQVIAWIILEGVALYAAGLLFSRHVSFGIVVIVLV